MGRGPSVQITLTPEEEKTLALWTKAGTTQQRFTKRANVILGSAQGLGMAEISRMSGLSPKNCGKWRAGGQAQRLAELQDRSRRGRPLAISPAVRLKVLALACTKPPDGSNAWTRRKLSQVVGVSNPSVYRILNEGRLQPHKEQCWCGTSPDQEFEAKQAAILALYLDPPDNALLLAVAEKTAIQTRDRTQPMLLQ